MILHLLLILLLRQPLVKWGISRLELNSLIHIIHKSSTSNNN